MPPSGETGRQPIGSDNSDDAVSDSQPSADATGRKRKAEDDSDLDSPPLKRAAVTSSEATSSAGTSSTVTAEASDQTPINLTNDVGGDRANGECHCQNERNCTICNCVSADQASGGSDDDLTNGSSGHQDDDDATTAEGNTDDASYVDSEEHDAEWDDAENDDNEWNGDDHDSEADGEDRCIDCGEVLSGMDRLAVPPSYRCSKCQSIREKTSRK